MRLREAEWRLQALRPFEKPRAALEQYPTDAHLAARLAHTADTVYGDLAGRTVVDLGCGCGMLMAAVALYSPAYILGIDIDPSALSVCRRNLGALGIDTPTDLVRGDALCVSLPPADVVVTNPPFGTKNNAGTDLRFVERALGLAARAVYSMHKSSTRDHVQRRAAAWPECQQAHVLAEMSFVLPRTMSFHARDAVSVAVDLWRFEAK